MAADSNILGRMAEEGVGFQFLLEHSIEFPFVEPGATAECAQASATVQRHRRSAPQALMPQVPRERAGCLVTPDSGEVGSGAIVR